MILGSQLNAVRRVMLDAGFPNVSVHDNVVFFSSSETDPRVDFLRVDANTMQKLLANAVEIEIRGFALKVPAIRDQVEGLQQP
ncbi:MAG: hypothetical protein O2923_12980 [Verrucomicrobia bacterium]|nr:hypothetical protein [Verrucomicrobiota bacterium]MDA1088255.1 hypothetical protein [Verrucomicrobiota bacterium]